MITNPTLGAIGATTGTAFFSTFFGALLTLLLIVGSVVFLFMLVVGAIQWMGAGNDKNAIEAGRGRIVNALIGIIILFAIYAVVNIVGVFFGNIDLLNPVLTPLTGGGSTGAGGGPSGR